MAQSIPTAGASRREFLIASAAAAAATTLRSNLHAAGSDVIKVGLIGCGGRGTGAAGNALNAGPDVRLTAMGDVFADRLHESLEQLRSDEKIASRIDVKPEHCFTGFDAYKSVLGSGVDVVLLATPPHFRPLHLKAAVDAGKHIFCEKPVAVDAPGVRKVLSASREAKQKGLSLVSGLCWRYHPAKREVMQRIHEGAIGEIVALHCVYNTGALWHRKRKPAWSDMEWQLRNWLYFTWLSGDHIVEQHIHSIDKMLWTMKDQPPAKAVGTGGRQARTGPEFGHIWDHFAINFEWPNGVKLFSYCRQQAGTAKDVSDYVMGTQGTCFVKKNSIQGAHPWQCQQPRDLANDDIMYQREHDELFNSIRTGKPINDGERMSQSTLAAILGRMAAYTGQVITWEQALNSREDLTPPVYEFGPLPVPPVAVPGVTRFI